MGLLSAQGSAGAYTTSPAIAFYRVAGATLVNSAITRDTCFETTYTPSGDTVATIAPPVSAGSFVLFAVGGHTDTLKRSNSLDPYYRASGAIAFTPGDSVTVTIPGDANGFPMSSFRAGTAEAFTVDTIASVTEGDPVSVTWTSSRTPGSAMLIAFRYASSGARTLDREVACSLVDDGSVAVSGAIMQNWERATIREAVAQRLRSLIAQVSVPRSYFNLTSTFAVSMTTR